MNLFVFGLGYSATRFVQSRGEGFATTGTVTTPEKARALTRPGLEALVFSPEESDPRIEGAIADADVVVVSIGPDEAGDPAFNAYAEHIRRAPRLATIVYLSTIGVYGDYGGAWIDESAECRPINARGRWRLGVEDRWRALGAETGKDVHILRLAGIYGPGNNAIVNLRRGVARRIVKPGQVFNRVHVEDIARTIDACVAHKGGGVWNVADDEPAPAEEVVAHAAELIGAEPPPLIDFEAARLSEMARSFYSECKRARNTAMRERLGVALACPTYREGLRACLAAGD